MATLVQPTTPFRAFSGANITAVIGNRIVGSLQAITCSITREVGAVYSFGNASPRAFVKGKRGIAGSLVFTQFDEHPLLQDVFKSSFDEPLKTQNSLFQSRFLDLTNQQGLLNGESFKTRNFEQAVGSNAQLAFPGGVANEIQQELQTIYGLVAENKLRYTDQLPEFDIIINFVNDSGDAAFLVVGGVSLVNEGWGWSLDDLTSETAITYVAKAVTPMTSLSDGTQKPVTGNLKFENNRGNPVPSNLLVS